MFQSIKKFFISALFEYSIALFFLIYILTYQLVGFPSPGELWLLGEQLFAQYGYWFLVTGIMIEGLFMVGFYFPGSVAIFGSIIFLAKSVEDVFLVIIVGSISLVAINIINYLLGKHGYYKLFNFLGAKKTLQRMESRFAKSRQGVTFLFSSSPNFLAIASIYAGITRTKISEYFSFMALCVFFWVSLVSAILFIFFQGLTISDESNIGWYGFAITLGWAIFESILATLKERKQKKPV